ncbi:MAG: 30S ribosomal protein S4e [Methanosarcinaceae archaeon]|nr:30S ribosomal protein S4e [Methanosarcinaceae archaeon]
MGKHQKRISAPKSWHISKKSNKWITSIRPGPHNKEQSLPITIVLRDMLSLVDNRAEAKRVLSEGKILIDGVVVKDLRFPVGWFDVISIPLNNAAYRVLLDQKGRLVLHKLDDINANKLCRINNKTTIKNGMAQLNLSDGKNLIGSNDYKAKDSVILSIPDKKILKHLEYKVGNLAMIVGGRHTGEIGKIEEINTVRSSKHNTVKISGNYDFETIEDYVVVIGEDEPEIKLGGEAIE